MWVGPLCLLATNIFRPSPTLVIAVDVAALQDVIARIKKANGVFVGLDMLWKDTNTLTNSKSCIFSCNVISVRPCHGSGG